MLFDSIIYGPVHSRRLGVSLGVNIMPTRQKLCSFDCIYCECGLNEPWTARPQLPTLEDFDAALDMAAKKLETDGVSLDVITFSGNGEPTLHPQFENIMQHTVSWRGKYHPDARICVLSNSTQLRRQDVMRALKLADRRILKLDGGTDSTMRLIDRPANTELSVSDIVGMLKEFNGDFTLQTCFLRGTVNGRYIDNTTDEEVSAWLKCVETLKPEEVMIYVIDRKTPFPSLEKIPRDLMERIAGRVRDIGIPVIVSA